MLFVSNINRSTIIHRLNCSLKYFKQSYRLFYELDTSPSIIMRNSDVQTIHTEAVHVLNHGRLEVRCPFNLHITPIDEKEFPRLDRAFFTIYGDSGFRFSKHMWNRLFNFLTVYSTNEQTLRIIGQFTEMGKEILTEQAHTLELHCQIPLHYELDINCSDNNNVNVEYFQCPRIHVQTQRGECSFKNIVADSIVAHSQCGNIICSGSLHGAIDLSTQRNGIIRASKLQGGFVRLKVENADINVRDLDSEHFLIQGQQGYFRFGDLHGRGIIDLNNGSINIASVNGDISVQCEQGDVNTVFDATNSSTIRLQKGNVKMSVINTATTRFNLLGKRIRMFEDARYFCKQIIRKDGTIHLQGFLPEVSTPSTIDVNAPNGTIEVNVQHRFFITKHNQYTDDS